MSHFSDTLLGKMLLTLKYSESEGEMQKTGMELPFPTVNPTLFKVAPLSLKTPSAQSDSPSPQEASLSREPQDPPRRAEAQDLPEVYCRAPKSGRGLPWRKEPRLDSYLSPVSREDIGDIINI